MSEAIPYADEFEPIAPKRPIQLTLITSDTGSLAKSISLVDGKIVKTSFAQLATGRAETIELDNITQLPKLIGKLQPTQALMTGVADKPVCNIVTSRQLTPELARAGYCARTKDFFKQPGKGFVLFDYDVPESMPEHLRCSSAEDLMNLLARVPKLSGLQYLVLPSSSAGVTIVETGECNPSNGLHIYIEASYIKLEELHRWLEVRLWQAGLGYIGFARNGALLVKHIIDLSVLSPERLIFEASPMLGPGLVQAERDYTPVPGVDLSGDFSITDEEYAAYIAAVAAAKKAPEVIDKAGSKSEAYVRLRGSQIAKRDGLPIAAALEKARKTLPQPAGNKVLLQPEFLVDLGDRFISAQELVTNGKDYDGVALPDPIEGRDYGMTTAKFYYNEGNPRINSFAHGSSQLYSFARPSVGTGEMDAGPSPFASKTEERGSLAKFSLNGLGASLAERAVSHTYLFPGIALMGQWTAPFSAPNCGKTLLTLTMLPEAISRIPELRGNVYYIDADDTLAGLSEKVQLAEEAGFHILAPGEKGFLVEDFLQYLDGMSATDSAAGIVVILDTLKKFTDLLDKTKAARFGKSARQFVQKGGTLITLAHVNKRVGANGKPVPEGTADIINDADCAFLLYEVSRDDDDQTKVVKFENIKSRGNVSTEVHFKYSTAATISYSELLASVERIEFISNEAETVKPTITDANLVSIAIAAIQAGVTAKMQLRDEIAKHSGVSNKRALQLIEKFTGQDPSIHKWYYLRRERGRHDFYLLPVS